MRKIVSYKKSQVLLGLLLATVVTGSFSAPAFGGSSLPIPAPTTLCKAPHSDVDNHLVAPIVPKEHNVSSTGTPLGSKDGAGHSQSPSPIVGSGSENGKVESSTNRAPEPTHSELTPHPATGDNHPATGDNHPATGDNHPATGDNHPATGDNHRTVPLPTPPSGGVGSMSGDSKSDRCLPPVCPMFGSNSGSPVAGSGDAGRLLDPTKSCKLVRIRCAPMGSANSGGGAGVLPACPSNCPPVRTPGAASDSHPSTNPSTGPSNGDLGKEKVGDSRPCQMPPICPDPTVSLGSGSTPGLVKAPTGDLCRVVGRK